jgi:hypothetical protein
MDRLAVTHARNRSARAFHSAESRAVSPMLMASFLEVRRFGNARSRGTLY